MADRQPNTDWYTGIDQMEPEDLVYIVGRVSKKVMRLRNCFYWGGRKRLNAEVLDLIRFMPTDSQLRYAVSMVTEQLNTYFRKTGTIPNRECTKTFRQASSSTGTQ